MAKSSSLSLSTVPCWVKLVCASAARDLLSVCHPPFSQVFSLIRPGRVLSEQRRSLSRMRTIVFFLYYVVSSCMLLTIKKESFQELLEEEKVFKERYCSVH